MAVTKYYTVNGRIRGESTNGVSTTYGFDALGSVTGTYDQNGNPQNTYAWAPYGTQVAKTGTATDPKFGWNGASGYRGTSTEYSSHYVRARHFNLTAAQWAALDNFWPARPGYSYCNSNPTSMNDPSGLFASIEECNYQKCVAGKCVPRKTHLHYVVSDTCKRYSTCIDDPKKLQQILFCWESLGVFNHYGPLGVLTCIASELCDGSGPYGLRCVHGVGGEPTCGRVDCAYTNCGAKLVNICYTDFRERCSKNCFCDNMEARCFDLRDTLIHELIHACGNCEWPYSDELGMTEHLTGCIDAVCGFLEVRA